ncbi:DUF2218 domain-containing protein [Vibrio sp. SCSIO 43136]|uniref:DUF2218 domain-containing protein n=1 Tax=Vibrio sp. SCSIO 43136 TaxID=2819101 RepID=UPI002074ACA7|nr:DUF2218 domain-containing protein [Vibrio sp. SCSIO 43136]USD64000.1 DUF2218 domain-containing protein [Vibrio sp. SCSIO 43136]
MKSYTYIQSEHVEKYLVTLCRHFARKVPATWDDLSGKVEFPMGTTSFSLDQENKRLNIECNGKHPIALIAQQRILNKHMDMFSRRETIVLKWKFRWNSLFTQNK